LALVPIHVQVEGQFLAVIAQLSRFRLAFNGGCH
jgi:hypothetical protein